MPESMREFEQRVLIDGGETVGNPRFDGNGDPTSTISTVDGNQPHAWRNYHASKRQEATPYFVEDGTNVKLREVSIRYDFADLIGLEGIRSLRFGVSGRNLLTFTGYDGFDPEVSGEDQDVRNERKVALFGRALAFYDARRLGELDSRAEGGGVQGVWVYYIDGNGDLVLDPDANSYFDFLGYYAIPDAESDFNPNIGEGPQM
ncbi:MAG: hypothetical protein U5J63_13170 [Fodinibius sp.]|nr:hypothetical protein [Fodinibius sp.]